jgi:hypothetical protein
MKSDRKEVTVALPAALYRDVQVIAERTGSHVGAVLKQLIVAGLDVRPGSRLSPSA